MSGIQPPMLHASCFEPCRRIIGVPEVTNVRYDLHTLRISLTFEDRENQVQVVFHESKGFRVLDEGDLNEFWNPEARPEGWLWRVSSGGWLDLERTRPTFFTGLGDKNSEYLILGVDDCVSVIASAEPILEVS